MKKTHFKKKKHKKKNEVIKFKFSPKAFNK